MVWAGRLINEIIRLLYMTHTLQLVIEKGLFPAEVLVTWAKRLINFFTIPKQTEKLLEIQKSTCHANNKVINILC